MALNTNEDIVCNLCGVVIVKSEEVSGFLKTDIGWAICDGCNRSLTGEEEENIYVK